LDGAASDAVAAYNRTFARPAIGRSLLQHQLPTYRGLEPKQLIDHVHDIRICYLELRSTLLQFSPRYHLAEGDEFEFAPDCSKRILPDGTIERYLADQFILALDIIGSTDSATSAQFKTNILAILDRSAVKGVRFATAGDDKFVTCHPSAKVLWDLAAMIQVDGAMLSTGTMRGSRKGLFFGGVTLQEKRDGRVLVLDTNTPHVIPRAVGTIDATKIAVVAKRVGENAVIAVDQFALERASEEFVPRFCFECLST
jgi:hypothetical protein